MRIGIIGTESDHVADLLRLANRARRWASGEVVALCGAEADRDRTLALAARYGADVVAEPTALVGRVDAVAVLDRHADRHAAEALPFLAAGLPVFVDKPLAATERDADRMLAAAERSGAKLLSASALRWQPDTELLKRDAKAAGTIEAVATGGIFDPRSPYGGSIFYGVHVVELALELAGAVTDVAASIADEAALTLLGRAGAVAVEMRMTLPPDGASLPFRAAIRTATGEIARSIVLSEDYMAPVFDRFIAMAQGGPSPLTPDQLLATVRILELGEQAVRRALSR